MNSPRIITTSKKEKPDYYLQIDKAKLVPNKKIVAGPTQLYIADVPTPAILPFAYFPLEKERTSGFLIPSWGENSTQGYFLQNGGYYFAVSDYADLTFLGDIYSNGSWGVRAETKPKFMKKSILATYTCKSVLFSNQTNCNKYMHMDTFRMVN